MDTTAASIRGRSTTAALVVLAALLVAGGAGAAAAETGCDAVVDAVSWDVELLSGPVTVRGAALHPELIARYARNLSPTLQQVQADIGGLEAAELCLVEDAVPMDAAAVGWEDARALRAAAFGPERAVVLSVTFRGLVEPAAILGLTYVAQWQSSAGTYPEPFGEAVRQYYRSGAAGELARDHNVLRFANLVDRFDAVDWTAGRISDRMLWHLETQDGALGDFVDFAVNEGGRNLLAMPEASVLGALDEQWRQALLDEARGGGPTTGWIAGLATAVGVVVLAVVLALANHRRRRRQRPRPA